MSIKGYSQSPWPSTEYGKVVHGENRSNLAASSPATLPAVQLDALNGSLKGIPRASNSLIV